MGDIAKFCPVHLRPAIPHYVPLLLRSVLPENTASSNNACWALGEITFSSGTLVAPFVPDLVTALIPIITGRRMAASLLENSAITLGRLALVSPDAVAVHLPTLAQCWCSALASVRAHQEKEAAFHGLCAVVRLNPNGMVSALEWFIKAIASCTATRTLCPRSGRTWCNRSTLKRSPFSSSTMRNHTSHQPNTDRLLMVLSLSLSLSLTW